MNFNILRYDTIGSTNTEALEQARRGAGEGVCIAARQQTGGRGRHGRVWNSPKDAGLYFSLILRPTIETRFLPLITLMSAVAVHDTLEELYALDCDIKWVNDIHVKNKKISGILAETGDTPQNPAVVVGIGINLSSANFPPEIAANSTSIETETGAIPDKDELLAELTENLAQFYEILSGANGDAEIRREWTRRSSYADGKNVRVRMENRTVTGITRGIEENGALRIETKTGEIESVHAGDVENLRAGKQEGKSKKAKGKSAD